METSISKLPTLKFLFSRKAHYKMAIKIGTIENNSMIH